MSQGIYIIDSENLKLAGSATLAEMWSQIERQLEQEAPVNPKFVELAKRVTAKFPTAEALSHTEEDEDQVESIWLRSPVDEATALKTPVWHFGLPAEQSVEVLHEMVNRATSLGLAVLADHLGVGFLPQNRVVPTSQQEQWTAFFGEAPEQEKLTKAQMRKKLTEMLGERLAPHGFTFLKERQRYKDGTIENDQLIFMRNVSDGWQCVQVLLDQRRYDGIVCFGSAYGVNFAVQKIMRSAGLQVAENHFGQDYDFNLGETEVGREIQRPFQLQKNDVFDQNVVGWFLDALVLGLVPLLDQMGDIDGIDIVLNRRATQLPGRRMRLIMSSGHVAMVCSHLMRNPDFDELVELNLRAWGDRTDAMAVDNRAQIVRLVKYLREHVTPLVETK